MRIFLDTCSLFKLYHLEPGTKELKEIFTGQNITVVFLSELSKIEFASTIWKKMRMSHLTQEQAQKILTFFEHDLKKFTFIPIDSLIVERALQLMEKYGLKGLRTLDSIQLATSVVLKDKIELSKTSDILLESFMKSEGLPVTI